MSINMSATTVPSRLASLFQRNSTDTSHNHGLPARLEEPEATTSELAIAAASGGTPNADAERVVEPHQSAKATRRRYSKAEKLRILRLADACKERGQLGALLRREGIYSSTLRDFQQQRAHGQLEAGYEREKQAARIEADQDKKRIAQLQAQNRQLQRRLEQAQLIIDVPKKLSQLLGICLPPTEPTIEAGHPTRS
jgi:transposase